MSHDTEQLELALRLMFQGIFPSNHKRCSLNYSVTKREIKKQVKCELTVSEIDSILSIVLVSHMNFSMDPRTPENSSKYKDRVLSDIASLQPKLTEKQCITIVNILMDLSPVFNNDPAKLKSILQGANPTTWSGGEYLEKKGALNALFSRELTKDEFHFLAEKWFYYMSFKQDIESSQVSEIINENNQWLSDKITHLKESIASLKHQIDSFEKLERFIFIDIQEKKDCLEQERLELNRFKQQKAQLSRGNGKDLSKGKLMEQAYFSLCASDSETKLR